MRPSCVPSALAAECAARLPQRLDAIRQPEVWPIRLAIRLLAGEGVERGIKIAGQSEFQPVEKPCDLRRFQRSCGRWRRALRRAPHPAVLARALLRRRAVRAEPMARLPSSPAPLQRQRRGRRQRSGTTRRRLSCRERANVRRRNGFLTLATISRAGKGQIMLRAQWQSLKARLQ